MQFYLQKRYGPFLMYYALIEFNQWAKVRDGYRVQAAVQNVTWLTHLPPSDKIPILLHGSNPLPPGHVVIHFAGFIVHSLVLRVLRAFPPLLMKRFPKLPLSVMLTPIRFVSLSIQYYYLTLTDIATLAFPSICTLDQG